MLINNVITSSRNLNRIVNIHKELLCAFQAVNVHGPFNYHRRCVYRNLKNGPWSVLFFGTDDFALESLVNLHSKWMDKSLQKLEVVTVCKDKDNAVTKYAKENGIVMKPWPLEESLTGYHLGVVVSFGKMIPRRIISSFPLGMLNVHGSLLPRWRGAAPIIYTLMNGDPCTGVTIMKIMPKQFDIGDIVMQRKIDINPDETLPELYARLKKVGAELLIETLEKLPDVLETAVPQDVSGVTYAPKVTSKISLVRWDEMNAKNVYDLQRALTGLYPLTTHFEDMLLKLIDINILEYSPNIRVSAQKPGCAIYDKKNKVLIVTCKENSYIAVKRVIVPGRPPMNAQDFNNGFIAGRKHSMVSFLSY